MNWNGRVKYGHRVMRVEPGALALGRAEGKEVLEDALVRDHAADQRDQHDHGGDADDPHADAPRMQLIVKIDEMVAALGCALVGMRRVAHADLLAGQRVEIGRTIAALRLEPVGRQALFGALHRPDFPHVGLRMGLGHEVQRQLQALRAVGDLGRRRLAGVRRLFQRVLGLHPVADRLFEHRQGAGQENGEQQPGNPQPAPGMQPGHGLAQAARLRRPDGFFQLRTHAAPRDSSRPRPPQAIAGSSMPSQARRRSCTANTQITAQV